MALFSLLFPQWLRVPGKSTFPVNPCQLTAQSSRADYKQRLEGGLAQWLRRTAPQLLQEKGCVFSIKM